MLSEAREFFNQSSSFLRFLRFTFHVLRFTIHNSPSRIQKTLQQNRRRHRIHFLLAVGAADVALKQHAVGLRGGQALIPRADRNGYDILKPGDKLADLLRGWAVGAGTLDAMNGVLLVLIIVVIAAIGLAVYSSSKASGRRTAASLADAKADARRLIERLGGQEFQRLGDNPELVADRHADAFCPDVEGKDAHTPGI